MKVTNEQIFNAAVTLMAGAMAGAENSGFASSRLRNIDKESATRAVKGAILIAEITEEQLSEKSNNK